MSEPDDIRSLLTAKSRSKVAPRDASLISKRSEVDLVEESSSRLTDSQLEPVAEPLNQDFSEFQAELDKLPSMGKRLAVHLEENLRGELVRLCERNDITPETFIEAAFAAIQHKPALVEEIVADAKVRLRERKRAGFVRRTLAMVQKLR